MNRRQPNSPAGQVEHAVAVHELVTHDSDYDTSSSAWVEFDRRMTEQFAELEQRLQRYFTPIAIRQSLGR